MNIKEKVTKSAEILREEIVKSPSSFSRWPPYTEERDNNCAVIPALLQYLLKLFYQRIIHFLKEFLI